MNLTVEILLTDVQEGKQVLAGEISLKGGKLKLSPKAGYEDLLQRLKENFDEENETAKDFVKNLPRLYSGSALRARLVNLNSEDGKLLRKTIESA